jgi:hypothetical protein
LTRLFSFTAHALFFCVGVTKGNIQISTTVISFEVVPSTPVNTDVSQESASETQGKVLTFVMQMGQVALCVQVRPYRLYLLEKYHGIHHQLHCRKEKCYRL